MYHGAAQHGGSYSLEAGAGAGGYLSSGVCGPPAHQLFSLPHVSGQPGNMAAAAGAHGPGLAACSSWQGNGAPVSSAADAASLAMNFGNFKLPSREMGTHPSLSQAFPRYSYGGGNMMPWCNNMGGLQTLQRGPYEFRECVQCGTVTQPCYPDGTGHYLCGACFCNPKWKGIAHPRFFNARRGSPYARRFHSMCTNCGTTQTTLWRRNNEGESGSTSDSKDARPNATKQESLTATSTTALRRSSSSEPSCAYRPASSQPTRGYKPDAESAISGIGSPTAAPPGQRWPSDVTMTPPPAGCQLNRPGYASQPVAAGYGTHLGRVMSMDIQ